MGILQKVMLLLQRVDPDCQQWLANLLAGISDTTARRFMQEKLKGEKALWDYTRKLGILRECIYGVDIQPIAVEISRLRCFLSLMVEENITDIEENRGILPLPNLAFKFVCANTLLGISKLDWQLYEPQVRKEVTLLGQLRGEYLNSQGAAKIELQKQFKAVQKSLLDKVLLWAGKDSEVSQLATWKPFADESCAWFDPFWMFGVTEGFDIVIGNPPYIRSQSLDSSLKESLQNYQSATGNYDLYVIFVEHGLKLLNPQGQLAFILPHKFFNAKYGVGLRKLIAEGQHLHQVIHFGGHQIFEGATNCTCLLFLQNHAASQFRFVQVEDLATWYQIGKAFEETISTAKVTAEEWNFVVGKGANILERLKSIPTKLEDITLRIFQGLKTSADKIYIVEEIQRETNRVKVYSTQDEREYWLESDLLHPLIKGGDSKSYHILPTSRLIVCPYIVDDGKATLISAANFKKSYPLTWAYLSDYKSYLENRERGKMKGENWYAYGRSQALNVITFPKIFTPDIAINASFSLDETGELFFTGGVAGGYGILVKAEYSPKYILALLNSKVLNWFIQQTSTQMRGGYYNYESRYIRELPILVDYNSKTTCDQIVILVDYIIYLKQQPFYHSNDLKLARDHLMVRYFEQLIDGLVYELYFPDELHNGHKQFATLLTQERLPPLDQLNGDKVAELKTIFERLFDRDHPIRKNIYFLDSIPVVRIVEGKDQ
jgi:hypothetical protein